MSDPTIRVERLGKRFSIGAARLHGSLREAIAATVRAGLRRAPRDPEQVSEDSIWALRDIDFVVPRGEVVGIVGRNGAGKSTLLKIVSRITQPTEGRVELLGRVGSLLEVGTGFHPELTGRENVQLNGAILGMRRAEIRARFDEIVDFSGVERFLDMPVKRYSTGMRMRLAFAVAAHLDPEILLVDEVLAVGDAEFQRKCLGKMSEVARCGRTVLFVSHNMAAMTKLCDRALLLRQGRMVLDGSVESVVREYVAEQEDWPISQALADAESGVELHTVGLLDSDGRPIGRVLCGDTFSIALDLQCKRELDRVEIHIAVSTTPGSNVCLLSNVVAGAPLTLPSVPSRVTCEVLELSLVPGSYDIDVKVLVDGEMALFRQQAGKLVVESGDFFGTGRLPPAPWDGVCLLKQSWRLDSGANDGRAERTCL